MTTCISLFLTFEFQIVPFIDGINSVRRIAERAEADFILVKKCIEHLLYAELPYVSI